MNEVTRGSSPAQARIAAMIQTLGVGRFMPMPLRRLKRRILGEPPLDLDLAAAHWDQEAQTASVEWMAIPAITREINSRITTIPWLYPLSAFKVLAAVKPLAKGLSIGCGTGNLERIVHQLRICDEIVGLDISSVSLRQARKLARRERMRGIHYRRADFNELRLPREAYDIVFFHGSLHHVSDPDRLLAEVHESLKPGGYLYVDEYVGPSRDEWTSDHLAAAQDEYDRLDEELKLVPLNPPIAMGDPSEMVRSSRILGAIEDRFEVATYRPYWGNLLFPLICALDSRKLLEPAAESLVQAWIDRENELIANGTFETPLFAVVVGRRP